MENSKFGVIIVAGGSGSRMGFDIPKQYLPLKGKAIIEHSIEVFKNFNDCKFIHVVIAKDAEAIFKPIAANHNISYSFGGATRQESVRLGIEEIYKNPKLRQTENILIHDAARPLLTFELVEKLLDKLKKSHAVLPVSIVSDTIKKVDEGKILETINRENYYLAQTPQAFNLELIYNLHQKYKNQSVTDDIALCEKENIDVGYIINDGNNYKITTDQDYSRAKKELEIMDFRVGNGFDVHQFEEGDGVILCGIKIPYHKKLKGHSDADCAWHALTDAILGAIGAGDIGEIFPDSDNKWKNADSFIFLKKADKLMKENNYEVTNIDITIISEEPKLQPYKVKMAENTANCLKISMDRVNIKATTTEKLGFLGRKEGLAVTATVCLKSDF